MEQIVEACLRILEGLGPVGAYIAAGIVGLTLAIIIIARTANLFDTTSVDRKKTGFLDRVIAQYDKVVLAKDQLEKDAHRVEAENDDLKDRHRELLTSVELLRIQLRRAIDLLVAVSEGRLSPTEIEPELKDLAK